MNDDIDRLEAAVARLCAAQAEISSAATEIEDVAEYVWLGCDDLDEMIDFARAKMQALAETEHR